MSLNNIQLPAIVIQELYKNSLVDLDSADPKKTVEKAGSIAFLGSNQRRVTIIASDSTSIYLADEDLNFLMGILSACKLTMADVALVNIAKTGALSYSTIEEELNATTVLLFGIAPSQLQLPLQFPKYQIQKFNNQVYLAAPALGAIAADKTEKTRLWNCLKQIFLNS